MAVGVVKEMRNVITFAQARQGLPTAEDADANLRNSFVNALRVQINALPALAPADAAPLNEVLKDSPYGVEGTAKIVEALDAKLHQAQSPSGKKAKKPAPQHTQLLKCPWNFPVQAEWDIILNRKKSLRLKMTTLVDRLNLVGCTHPCEQTLKWVLAVALMAHYFEMPSPKIIALWLDELKEIVASERKPSYHTQIIEFPISPHDLPTDLYERAYATSPPVTMEFEGIMSFAETSIPLRKNSKLLHKAGTQVIKEDGQQEDEQSAMSRPLKRSQSIPTDDDELELYHEYKAKLAKLKKQKGAVLTPIKVQHADNGHHGAFGVPLNVNRQPDGSLMLAFRGRVICKSEHAWPCC